MRRAQGPPAHDPSSIGVDDKGDVDEAGPGCDIGEVGEPKDILEARLPFWVNRVVLAVGQLLPV
jgi:hypothetical protein